MVSKNDEKKIEEAADKKLNDLLSVVDPRMVLEVKNNGTIFIGGTMATPSQLANLKSEAEFFAASDLWKLIVETQKELAQRAMFVSGESLDDMKKGRSMLYLLANQKKVIDTFKSYQQQ